MEDNTSTYQQGVVALAREYISEWFYVQIILRADGDQDGMKYIIDLMARIGELSKIALLSQLVVDELFNDDGDIAENDFFFNILTEISLNLTLHMADNYEDGYHLLCARLKESVNIVVESGALSTEIKERIELSLLDEPIFIVIYLLHDSVVEVINDVNNANDERRSTSK